MSGWIVHGTQVVSSVNIAASHRDKRVGMKAHDDASIPLVIEGCRWVHTFGMKFPVDVVYLDAESRIVAVHAMKPHRLGWPVRSAVCVIETEPGALRRWGLRIGDTVEIRPARLAGGTGDAP